MEQTGVDMERRQCLNCSSTLHSDALYCHTCGQGIKESKLSILQVIKEAFVNFFNLDGRFFHTLRDLYSPSKLTKTYVDGKRRFYMNPARLFLVSLIIFISVAMSDLDLDHIEMFGSNNTAQVELAKQKRNWDALMEEGQFGESEEVLAAVSDSLFGDIDIDSLYLRDGMSIAGKSIKDYKIRLADAFALSSDELLEKYEIKGFWDRLYVKQYHKILVNPSGGIRYVIKNATWVVLILIFVMAIFMKLFYIRSKRYYVEHLVLLMYGHSLLFIAASLFLLLILLVRTSGFGGEISAPFALAILAIQYLSLKKYYRQGWLKTLLKMLMINFTYFITAIMIFSLGAVISFAIF